MTTDNETVLREAVSARDAFEMGFVWAQSLTGQTLEDSRAVGRTLSSDTFKALAPEIERQIKLQGFDSFRCADDGIVAAKRIILAALSRPASASEGVVEALQIMVTAFAGYADTNAKREAVQIADAELRKLAGQ